MEDITNQSCNYLEVQPSTSAGMKDICGIKSYDIHVTEKTVTEQPMTSAGMCNQLLFTTIIFLKLSNP